MIRYILALMLFVQASAFAPNSGVTFRPASIVQGVMAPTKVRTPFVLAMSDEDKQVETVETAQISADGTFYDDEVSHELCWNIGKYKNIIFSPPFFFFFSFFPFANKLVGLCTSKTGYFGLYERKIDARSINWP